MHELFQTLLENVKIDIYEEIRCDKKIKMHLHYLFLEK